jgi:hypothetical protein
MSAWFFNGNEQRILADASGRALVFRASAALLAFSFSGPYPQPAQYSTLDRSHLAMGSAKIFSGRHAEQPQVMLGGDLFEYVPPTPFLPSQLFSRSPNIFVTPPAPSTRPILTVRSELPSPAFATLFSRPLAIFPALDVPYARRPMILASSVPEPTVSWVTSRPATAFPAPPVPAPRNTLGVLQEMPAVAPAPSFILNRGPLTIENSRPAKTLIGYAPPPHPEAPSRLFSRAQSLFPALAPPPPRRPLTNAQFQPQLLPSWVLAKAAIFPPTFSIIPGEPPDNDPEDFAIVPDPEHPIPTGPFPGYIQWQTEGVNLGLPNVVTINFVGDPAVILATRGVGEHANVVTVRLVHTPAPAVAPGWNTTNESGPSNWAFTNGDFTGEVIS